MRYWHILAATILVIFGCQESAPKKKSPNNDQTPYRDFTRDTFQNSTPPGGFTQSNFNNFGAGNGIDISVVGFPGNQLPVQLNQTVTWQFQARPVSLNGGSAQIESIRVNGTPPASMNIQGSTVTFRPQNQQELQGGLTVTARSGSSGLGAPGGGLGGGGLGGGLGSNGVDTKVFSWSSNTGGYGYNNYGNGGSGIGGILLGFLPSLLGINLGGLTGGGGNYNGFNQGFGGGFNQNGFGQGGFNQGFGQNGQNGFGQGGGFDPNNPNNNGNQGFGQGGGGW